MTAEEYLKQIKMIDAIIINKKKEYRRWKDIADGYGGGFSVSERVQTTRNLQRGSDAIIEYISIEQEISSLEKKRKGIIATIESLPCDEYMVIYAVFVDGYMVKELPSLIHKSLSSVKRTKAKALEHVQMMIDKKEG